MSEAHGSRGCAGYCISLRRPNRSASNRTSKRDESYGRLAVAVELFLWTRLASSGPQSLERGNSKPQCRSNRIPSSCMVQQQSAIRQIYGRDGNREGRIMFGAGIMRQWSVGALTLVMLSGTAVQSTPQVMPNGFLVQFDVSVNAPPAKVYEALVGQIGSWWNPEHTYSHDAKNLSIDARPGVCFCEKLPNSGGIE